MKADKALPLCWEYIEPSPVQISRLNKEGKRERKGVSEREWAGRQERARERHRVRERERTAEENE